MHDSTSEARRSDEWTRRTLLTRATGLIAGAATCGIASSCSSTAAASSPLTMSEATNDDWFRISLAQWSLHRRLRQPASEGGITNLDFARVAKDEFGVGAIEYVNQFFHAPNANGDPVMRGSDFGYLREVEAAAKDAGVESLLIMVDGEGQLAAVDDARRREAVENHFEWVAAAAYLGCHAIRVNAGGGGTAEEQAARAADSLRRIARVSDAYDIDVIVENHGGLSSDGSWLAGVMRQADHPRVGTLPDFGNFRINGERTYDRYKGVEELMPFAKAVSAKSHDFDDAGNEVHTDYTKMMSIVKEAGYRGWVGIEYEGGGLSEKDGILATKALLERTREELS